MSATIKYKGETLESLNGGEYITLHTKGKTMEDDIRLDVKGGGGSADLVYVTFMTHDGAKELHKRAVVKGNTCMCPVTGVIKEIDTPTRESTAEYNYTFAGWATTANGGLDENALKNVTEDRTVYANYIATIRTYAVRFFDGNTQVGNTQYVAYGANATAPEVTKEGFRLDGWNPVCTNITADTDCYAQWTEKVTFANATWEEIAEICEAGEASSNFSVGDTKTIPVTIDGVEYPHIFKIVGINHDDLADGSGKASLSIMSFTMQIKEQYDTSASSTLRAKGSLAYKKAVACKDYLPTDLQRVIKTVLKSENYWQGSIETSIDNEMDTWYPSAMELSGSTKYVGGGTQYEAFLTDAFGVGSNAIYDADGNVTTATGWLRNSGATYNTKPYWRVSESTLTINTGLPNLNQCIAFGFCI